MSEIGRLAEANRAFASAFPGQAAGRPLRHLAVVTCMDCRLDPLGIFGLELGEAHVIRNAGGRVTDDVVRSLTLSTHALGVDTVVLMQHTRCGLAGVTQEKLRESTGADIDFLPIADHAADLQADISLVANAPSLVGIRTVAGFIYDVDTGAATEVSRFRRPD